jgi:hypothetical protein
MSENQSSSVHDSCDVLDLKDTGFQGCWKRFPDQITTGLQAHPWDSHARPLDQVLASSQMLTYSSFKEQGIDQLASQLS